MTLKSFIKRYAPVPLLNSIINLTDNISFYRLYRDMRNGGRFMDVKLDTNNVCNLRCAMCYSNDLGPQEPRFMSIDEFRLIAEQFFPNARTLALSNASEPTMTRNFKDFIKVAASYGVPSISYCTNGLLLDEGIIEETILNKINLVTVSLDGATKKTYESIRSNSNFEKVIANLELFRVLKGKHGSGYPEISISYTAFDTNIDESVEFVEKYHHLFDTFLLNHLLTRKRSSVFTGKRVSKEKFDSVCGQIIGLCRKFDKRCEFVFNAVRSDRRYVSKCPLAISYRLIMSNGDLLLCNKQKLCNIFKDDYVKVAKDAATLEKLMNKKDPYCKTCMS